MAGTRGLEHDKPDVKGAESPHIQSPAHAEVETAQRAASLSRDTQRSTPEPKSLDLNLPIGGTAQAFDSNPQSRGLARDSSSAAAGASGQSDAPASKAGSEVPWAQPGSSTPVSLREQSMPFLQANKAMTPMLRPQDGGQFQPSDASGTAAEPKFGQDSAKNPSNFSFDPSKQEFDREFKPTQKSVLKGVSDAPLTREQKGMETEPVASQQAAADRLLKDSPGQSATDAAQKEQNRNLVQAMESRAHRQTPVNEAGAGKLGAQGGETVARFVGNKDFRAMADEALRMHAEQQKASRH